MTTYTEDELEDLCRTLTEEKHFTDRNAEWKENRRLVHREREVVFPGGDLEVQYLTPEPLEAADKYTARFLGAPITINVSAQGPGPKAIERAQAMENYDYRLYNRWRAAGIFHGPIHDMCGVTGEGWVHMTLNRELLPIIPEPGDEGDEAYLQRNADVWKDFTEGEKPDLITVEPVTEPETIYYDRTKSVILMHADVPLGPLARQYGREGAGGKYGEKGKSKAITKDGQKLTVQTIEGGIDPQGWNQGLYQATVKLYVVETADYIYHLVEDGENAAGKDYKNLVRLGCYKNVFGAPGFVNVQGRKTNHPSAKHAVHPLTHGMLALAPYHNIMKSIVVSGGVFGEWSRIFLKPVAGDAAALERQNNKSLEIELIGNRVLKVPDGYEAVQPNIGVNADTLNADAQMEAKMIALGYPPALGSPEEVDASSGYQQAVMRDTVANTLDPPLENIASMVNQLLRLKDTAIKTLGYPVTFRNFSPTDEMGKVARNVMDEITIDPDDIVEVDRSVSFDSLTQYARQAKIELGRGLLAEGRITEDMFFRDYMGVDDPQRLKKQRLIEKAMLVAENFALKAAEATFQEVTQDVAAEAVVDSGVAPFMQDPPMPTEPSLASLAGTYTQNGAGGPVPLEPAPPSQESAMGAAGVSYG